MADGRKGPGSNQYQDKPPSPTTAARPAIAASLRQQAAAEAAPPEPAQWASNCASDFDPDDAMRRHIAARNADPRLAAGLLPAGASVPTVTGSRLAAGSCPGTRVVADRTARAMDAFERTSLPDVECSSAAQEVLGPDRCTRTPACVGTSTSEGRCRQSGPSGLVRRPVGRRPPASITRGPDWSRYRRRTASRLAIAASWTPMVR